MNKAMKYLTPKKPISKIARDRAEEMEERNVDLYEAIAGLFEELAALEQSNAELKARVETLEKGAEMKVKTYMIAVYAVLVKNGKREIEELPEAYIIPVAEYLATQEEATNE